VALGTKKEDPMVNAQSVALEAQVIPLPRGPQQLDHHAAPPARRQPTTAARIEAVEAAIERVAEDEIVLESPTRGSFALRDVSVAYGRETAIAGVTMRIPARAVTALIGPSGCGKSTLLRCLNRMNDELGNVHVGGTITLDGIDVYSRSVDPVDLRRRVGQVFQKPNPFPMSIYDNVAYGPRTHGVRKRGELDKVVQESLERAALWNEVKNSLKKHAFELSGGQQQRLCIARALAVEPDILLMDEATSALDPISTLKIEELAQDLKDRYTIVMVTHNMHQAARVSQQTVFFLNGEVVEYSETEQLFSNPTDQRTEDYITGRFG
jgi:phosphate transport system ATP-binding protein